MSPPAISTVFPIHRILYSINIGSISNIKSPILTRPIKILCLANFNFLTEAYKMGQASDLGKMPSYIQLLDQLLLRD